MRIFHIATLADWKAAQDSGSYTTATRGKSLAEEGFIHASRGDQWQGVRERYYSDATEPLVLLSIDTALLTSPVVDETAPGTDETFPHIYGPIQVDAVLTSIPLGEHIGQHEVPTSVPPGEPVTQAPVHSSDSFSRLFLREVAKQFLLASLVLGCVVAATLVGLATGFEWGPISGAAVGLLLGVLAARVLARRRTD